MGSLMPPQDLTVDVARRAPVRARQGGGERSCFLTPFDALYAREVASWVRSDRELIWLAPSTPGPLTVQKVLAWGKNRDHCFLFWNGLQDVPIAYAELNKMSERPQTMWIGHFVLDPAHRGRSYGTQFARAMLASAFLACAATDVLLVVFPDNVAAIRCYERAGMAVVGRERKYFETIGEEYGFLRMGMHRARFCRLVAANQMPDKPLPFYTHFNCSN
jgi:RimJ/RimL family protein N-acetyltransferase